MSQEKRRRKKLERHRKRREARKRALAVADSALLSPEDLGIPKISDVLGAFVQPILQDLPEGTGRAAIENILANAALVWNALAMHEDEEDQERELEALIADWVSKGSSDPKLIHQSVYFLADRKRALFPDDARRIVDVSVDDRGGGRLALHATSVVLSSQLPRFPRTEIVFAGTHRGKPASAQPGVGDGEL